MTIARWTLVAIVTTTSSLGCAPAPAAYPPLNGYPAYGGYAAYGGAAPPYAYGYPSGWAPSAPTAPASAWGTYGLVPHAPGAFNAVAFAASRVGTPYCWGGTGPFCFDCSGLTHAAWQAGGKSIPRTSTDQARGLTPVPLQWAEPGDVLWRPGHVALYVGEGWVISAPGRGDVVRYQRADGYHRAVRPL